MPLLNCKIADNEAPGFVTIYDNAWIGDALAGQMKLWEGSNRLIVRNCTAGLFLQTFQVDVPPNATHWSFVEGSLLGFWDEAGKMVGKPLQASYQ